MSFLERTSDWLEERIGYRALVRQALEEPVPGGARWAYIFGSVLVGCIALQAITGWALMAYYAPSATTAWASVEHLNYSVMGGWLLRGLHHFGSQAMIVVLGLHVAQVAIYGAYKAPREVNWWLGLGLLGVTVGFGLTGYLLPWDQKGYWATRVATNIAGTMPLLGKAVQRVLVGGPEYGSMTLTRFYTLHIAILPLLLALLLVGHLALFRRHGVTPPASADTKKIDAFYPTQLAKDVGGVLLMFGVVVFLALREHGAPLDAPADPASDYPARPEWYFLSLFQLLKYFAGPLEVVGSMVVPGLAGLYLALLPIWDRSPDRALGPRLKYLAPLFALGAGVVVLTALSIRSDASDAVFQKARVVATQRAEAAIDLAKKGIPPDGPLAMMRRDPETRGMALFQEHCASCHRLGALGPEASKATAAKLDGWSTPDWIAAMIHDPDSQEFFGGGPYKGEMPGVDVRPKNKPPAEPWTPMIKNEGEKRAVALFLASQGDESTDPPRILDAATRTVAEKIVTERCTTCHLFKGEGDDQGTGIAPELSHYGSLAWTRAQIANPATSGTYRAEALSSERKGHMPRFDDKLEPEEIDVLAAWVRKKARAAK